VPQQGAQHGVDEPPGAGLAGAARHLHRLVHRRARRDAVEVENLIGAEAKDVGDLGIERLDRPAGEVRDQKVELSLPAKRAGRQLAGQRAVPRVRELLPVSHERRAERAAAGSHGPERPIGRPARRRDHGSPKRMPGASR
jgi:hypothetical protein